MSLSYHYYNILCQVYIFLAKIVICALMGDFFRVVIFLNVCTFVVYMWYSTCSKSKSNKELKTYVAIPK